MAIQRKVLYTEGSRYANSWLSLVKSRLGNTELTEDEILSALRIHAPNREPRGANDEYLKTLTDKVKYRLSRGIIHK